MGRGASTSTQTSSVSRSAATIVVADGDIQPLSAGEGAVANLDEMGHVGVENAVREPQFGDRATTLAIRTLSGKLRRKFPHLDDDRFEDLVIDLYNKACAKVISGQATAGETQMLAALRGEQVEGLRARINV